VSTALLIAKPLPDLLDRGGSVQVAFQAVNDYGAGVPDQALEVVISDITRLRFKVAPQSDHYVFRTGHSDRVDDVVLTGAVIVELEVPVSASPGTVAVTASLEGSRGSTSKTQWAGFAISDAGVAGAGGDGGGGGASGAAAGGDVGVAGLGAGAGG